MTLKVPKKQIQPLKLDSSRAETQQEPGLHVLSHEQLIKMRCELTTLLCFMCGKVLSPFPSAPGSGFVPRAGRHAICQDLTQQPFEIRVCMICVPSRGGSSSRLLLGGCVNYRKIARICIIYFVIRTQTVRLLLTASCIRACVSLGVKDKVREISVCSTCWYQCWVSCN